MLGLMQDVPLLISSLIRHADRHHGSVEIVSRRVEGDIHRCTYRELHGRSKRLANALDRLGIAMSDRVATLAWNGYRHMELYYGVAGKGPSCIRSTQAAGGPGGVGNRTVRAAVLRSNVSPIVEKMPRDYHGQGFRPDDRPRPCQPQRQLSLLCYEELLAAETTL